MDIISEIDDMGGVVDGIHKGYFRRADRRGELPLRPGDGGGRSHHRRRERLRGRQRGAARSRSSRSPHEVEVEQCERLAEFKKKRDRDQVQRALERFEPRPEPIENTMPALVDAALAGGTLGEMVQALADVYGRYTSGPEW